MEATHRSLTPLWHETTAPLTDTEDLPFRALQGDPVDAIVVGAGVTGLSTALHLAERGARVVVLERLAPGCGTTGSSNGQVIAGLQMPPDDLLAAYGQDVGERLIKFSGDAPAFLFELVERLGIACDAERAGWVQATRSRRGLEALAGIAEAWATRGAPARMLDARETTRLLGTDAYAGGWHDARNGTIQPFAYARGLAAAVRRAGVQVHHNVNVTDMERRHAQWHVRTDQGPISAPAVVLATNVFTSQLDGVAKMFLGRSYVSAHSVQVATDPLRADQLKSLLPERTSCGDTSHLRLRYFRLDAANRFVIGGPGWLNPPSSPSSLSFRLLEASARRMFPQLAKTPFNHHWAARDTVTLDLLPHLYEPEAGLFSALGFNGRGLAIGSALGSVLARRVMGEPAEAMPFPTTPATAIPLGLPAAIVFHGKVALGRFLHRER